VQSFRPCSVTSERAGNGAEQFPTSSKLRTKSVAGNHSRKTERGVIKLHLDVRTSDFVCACESNMLGISSFLVRFAEQIRRLFSSSTVLSDLLQFSPTLP